MYHELLRDASFWAFLFEVDQDLAKECQAKGCPCGGRLHSANYPRKPRGGPANLPESYSRRLSFCCDRDGCRKRMTPPSVRFLGRRAYLAAVVLVVAAMRQGPSPRRVRKLCELFDVDRRTIARWQGFWRDYFPQTTFWKAASGRLPAGFQISALPRSLLEAFLRTGRDRSGWERLLRFLAPATVSGGLKIKVSGGFSPPAEDALRRPRFTPLPFTCPLIFFFNL